MVSDEKRDPSERLSMVSRENWSELRIAVVGRTLSVASSRELLPGAASRKTGTSPRVIAAEPVKRLKVGVVRLSDPPHSSFCGPGTRKAVVSVNEPPGLLSTCWTVRPEYSDGSNAKELWVTAPPTSQPPRIVALGVIASVLSSRP